MPATPRRARRFGGDAAHQKLMMANLAASLFAAEAIVTTEAKAKALRPIAEKLITKARKGGLHRIREIQGLPHDQSSAQFECLSCSADAWVPNAEDASLLARLKDRIRQRAPNSFREYETNWNGQAPDYGYLDRLCADVLADLTVVIQAELARTDTGSALEHEVSRHAAFARERSRC